MSTSSYTLSVIVPVYNERATLRRIIERLRETRLPGEGRFQIIVVDDFSTDGTRDLYPAIRPLVDKILLHRHNQGKGAAIRTGLEHATGDYVVIQDADLEYNPAEFAKLLAPLLDGRADVVYGSRFLGGEAHRVLYFWHTVGNRLLTLFSNMMTDLNLTDMETCYKMFRREAVEGLTIEQNRFGVEPELTAKLARRNLRFYEVGISYDGRTYEEGKKIRLKDAFQAVVCILKYSRGRYRDIGRQTLQRLETADDYSEWIHDRIAGYLGDSVAEVGAGMGALARRLARKPRLLLLDLREDYVEYLQRAYAAYENIEVRAMNILEPDADLQRGEFDSVVSCNCLEHIEDDTAALRHMAAMLRPGGRLTLLVPAFNALFSPMDANLGHWRRYTRRSLEARLREAGLEPEFSSYMNIVGGAGWFVTGRLLRKGVIGRWDIRLHHLVQPVARWIERRIFRDRPPFGLSLICVARRPAAPAPGAAASME